MATTPLRRSRRLSAPGHPGYTRESSLYRLFELAGLEDIQGSYDFSLPEPCRVRPPAGGLLSGKFSRENQKPEGSRRSEFDFPIVDKERVWKILDMMGSIAKAHGCSPARIALAWLLGKPVVTSVIIGAKRPDHLHDNLAAVDLHPTQNEVKQLDEVAGSPLLI